MSYSRYSRGLAPVFAAAAFVGALIPSHSALAAGGAHVAAAEIVEVTDGGAQAILVDESITDLESVHEELGSNAAEATSLEAVDAIIAPLSDSLAARLESLPGVTVVENTLFTLSQNTRQDGAPWNLSRLDQQHVPVDSAYTFPASAGAGVRVYVIDSGVTPNPQFGNRLLSGVTLVNDGRGTSDCNGHGTHVAGTVASTSWGVAKKSLIVPVRVFDCSDTTTSLRVLAAIDWILGQHPAGTPGIINLSLSGDIAPDLDRAVTAASSAGFVVIAAAGNNNRDACLESPGAASAALTVGATTDQDARASFSNFGSCVDLFAPGWAVASVKPDGSSTAQYMSGTSMAAPHVAGVAALLWGSASGQSARAVESALLSQAVTGTLLGIGPGSPNRLVSVRTAIGAGEIAPPAPAPVSPSAVYRFWSDENQTHFYTISARERDSVIARYPTRVWKYEGVGFGAFSTTAPGTVPVYRFWSDTGQSHFYTASTAERDKVIKDYPDNVWRYEGVAFHVFPASSTAGGTRPVSRFWSPAYANHFYTASANETSYVRSSYPTSVWTYEGTAFRVPTTSPPAAPLP